MGVDGVLEVKCPKDGGNVDEQRLVGEVHARTESSLHAINIYMPRPGTLITRRFPNP